MPNAPAPLDAEGPPPDTVAVPSADLPSIARRRSLLKALGKASALAGATVPLRSLAVGGGKEGMRIAKADGKFYACSVSGNLSVLHSATLNNTTVCKGNPFSAFQPPTKNGSGVITAWSKWPAAPCPTPWVTFASVFGTATTPSTLSGLMDGATVASPGPAHWVLALLNAYKASSTFPYTPSEVIALYAQGGAQQAAALQFFKDYLET